MRTKIALGTAQFGMNYGITNRGGQVAMENVKMLLKKAHTAGIELLDTAQAYGNAEAVLGNAMPKQHEFKIISKLPAQGNLLSKRDIEKKWEKALDDSLKNLKVPFLEGLLLHSSADLVHIEKQRLLDWLMSIQERGLVRRIGVSIYESKDLDKIPINQLQLIQIPCSLYDQRLIHDGTVKFLTERRIAIHARSVYLQGLLVTPSNQWPVALNARFRHHHQALERIASERSKSLVDFALGWAKNQEWLEAAVIGVTQIEELTTLDRSWKETQHWEPGETEAWAWDQDKDLDPRQWKL